MQDALRAELEGNPQSRSALLEQARQTSPKEPAVQWLLGNVQSGKEWRSYEQVVARAEKSKQLLQYRELRDKSEPTMASQYELAYYCRKHNLKEQAAAHWSAIVELDPENEEARRALGFVKVGEDWIEQGELERERRTAMSIADAIRKSADDVRRIAKQLNDGKITHEKAVESLKERQSVYAIPIWESLLSSPSGAGALVAIDVLKDMQEPESTMSLARHAVWMPFAEARTRAREALKLRDDNAYIPAMLEELQGPMLAFRSISSDGSNRLISRYTLVADGKEKVQLKVLEDSFVLTGETGIAAALALGSAAGSQTEREITRRNSNAMQTRRNELIMDALTSLTGERELASPQEWWQWWETRTKSTQRV